MSDLLKTEKKSSNEVVMSCGFEEAFNHTLNTIKEIGSIKESNKKEQFIESKIKYGLQSIPVRTSLVERDSGQTTILIQASSPGIGDVSGKNVTKRLIEALVNIDNPGYKPDKRGMHPMAIVGWIILLIITVIIVNSIIL